MKKTMLSLIAACAMSAGLQAQTRNCGTMDYYEYRKHQDPSFESRMRANEQQTQEWIKLHQTAYEEETAEIHLPSIEGFHPAGYLTEDRMNYEKAKQVYLNVHRLSTQHSIVDAGKLATLREQKRKKNSFIQK